MARPVLEDDLGLDAGPVALTDDLGLLGSSAPLEDDLGLTPTPPRPGLVSRALTAVKERFVGGGRRVAGALVPVTPEEQARSVPGRVLDVGTGLAALAFPFAAAAGEIGGSAMRGLAESSGEMTDEALQARLAHARQFAPGEAAVYESLLAVPYEERVARTAAGGAMGAEFAASFVPGYTLAARGVQLLPQSRGAAPIAGELLTTPARPKVRVRPLGPETAEVQQVVPDPGKLLQGVRRGRSLGAVAAEEGAVPIVRMQRPGTTAEAVPTPRPMLTAETALRIEQEVGEKIPDALLGTRLSTETTKSLVNAAEATMTKLGVPRDPSLPVTLDIVRAMERHPEGFAAFERSLHDAGATLDDLAELFTTTASSAGRQLQQLGAVSQRLEKIPELRTLADALRRQEVPLSGWEMAAHFWSRFVNLWRGSLVTAWSTAVRNIETQVTRLALEPVEKLLDGTIRAMFRLPGVERGLTTDFRASLEGFHSLVSRGRQREATEILRAFPDEADRMFYRFSSDVARSSGLEGSKRLGPVAQLAEQAFDSAESAVNLFNVVNRGQEFLVRRAAFRTKLADLLDKRGLDLETVNPAAIPASDVAASVNHALEVTYAITPKSGVGKWLLDLYSNPLGKALSFVAPFPRFMWNSWKFQFDYSPAAFTKLLSSAERAKIAAGDTSALSKAVMGSGLYYAAWEIRSNSEYAGERWYEIKAGDRRIDMRPFAPFSGYLYLAELAKRQQQGTLGTTAEEMAKGAFEALAGFRAGAGMYMLDSVQNALEGLMGDGRSLEKVTRTIRRFAGEVAGGFVQPLTTARELFAEYGRFVPGLEAAAEEESKLRERAGAPFLGPLLAKTPGVSQTLPEKELPLQAATPRLESVEVGGVPLSRQLTGLAVQTRTPLEAEVNRLGLTRREIVGRLTGEPEADRLIFKHLGPLAEETLGRAIARPEYRLRSDAERRVLLAEALNVARQVARGRAFRDDPALFRPLLFEQKVGRRRRELLEERGLIPEPLRR